MARHPNSTPDALPGRLATTLIVACVGCGAPELHLTLRTPNDAPAPSGITRLVVSVLDDGAVLADRDQAYGEDVKLPDVEWQRDMWFDVAGLQDEARVAWAEAHPQLPAAPRACCIVACFCTQAQHEAGECTCGTDTCADRCPP